MIRCGTAAAWIVVIPEPATLTLLALGSLTLLRRRRSRAGQVHDD